MATKRKKTTRRVKRVKSKSCRSHGSVLSTSKNKKARKTSARKLGSKTCKTKADRDKTAKRMKKLTNKAKKIRKKNESWQSAMKRASKLI